MNDQDQEEFTDFLINYGESEASFVDDHSDQHRHAVSDDVLQHVMTSASPVNTGLSSYLLTQHNLNVNDQDQEEFTDFLINYGESEPSLNNDNFHQHRQAANDHVYQHAIISPFPIGTGPSQHQSILEDHMSRAAPNPVLYLTFAEWAKCNEQGWDRDYEVKWVTEDDEVAFNIWKDDIAAGRPARSTEQILEAVRDRKAMFEAATALLQLSQTQVLLNPSSDTEPRPWANFVAEPVDQNSQQVHAAAITEGADDAHSNEISDDVLVVSSPLLNYSPCIYTDITPPSPSTRRTISMIGNFELPGGLQASNVAQDCSVRTTAAPNHHHQYDHHYHHEHHHHHHYHPREDEDVSDLGTLHSPRRILFDGYSNSSTSTNDENRGKTLGSTPPRRKKSKLSHVHEAPETDQSAYLPRAQTPSLPSSPTPTGRILRSTTSGAQKARDSGTKKGNQRK